MNELPVSMLYSILALLLISTALLSASESALMAVSRYRLQQLIKSKHKRALKTSKLLEQPEQLFGLILLGKIFLTVIAASLCTFIALRQGHEYALIIGIVVLTLTQLIFSELGPKSLAAIKPETIAFSSSLLFHPLIKLFNPVVWIINQITRLGLRIFGVKTGQIQPHYLGKEELRNLLAEAEYLVEPRYHKMLLSVMDLESATVEDIMTPRSEILGIDLEDPIEEIVTLLQESLYTRLPVYKKTIDRVVGFLHVRSILPLIHQSTFSKECIIEKLSKPVFIPESTPLHSQMQNFKLEKNRIGLVIDEYGDVLGLVTLDDLLQEIVGELLVDDSNIKQHSDGNIVVDASVTIREFNRITRSTLPTEGPKTINGLILEYMETIPEIGTSITLHGYRLEITERDEKSIKQVRFYPS